MKTRLNILKDHKIKNNIAYSLIINIFLLSVVPNFHFHSHLHHHTLPYEILTNPHHHSGLAEQDCLIQKFIDKYSPISIITKLNISSINIDNYTDFIPIINCILNQIQDNSFPRAPPAKFKMFQFPQFS